MKRNEALFRDIADIIDTDPDVYDQTTWIMSSRDDTAPEGWCNTRGCIAGWAVIIHRYHGNPRLAYADIVGDGNPVDDLYVGHIPLHIYAQQALRLDEDESMLLFDSDWSPHEGLSVPDALRKIGEGAAIEDVTEPLLLDETVTPSS